MTTHVTYYLLRKLIRDIASRVFTGGESSRHLCLACSKFPDFQKESRCSTKCTLFVQFRHNEPLVSVLGLVETLLKSVFPDSSQRPTLQAGLSKDSHLRPASGNSFLHNSQKINLNLNLISYTNIKSKCIRELNTRAKTKTSRRKHMRKCSWPWVGHKYS